MSVQNGYSLVNRVFDIANSEEEIKKQVEIFVKNKNYLLVKYKIAPSVIDTIVQRIPILKNNTKTRRLTTH